MLRNAYRHHLPGVIVLATLVAAPGLGATSDLLVADPAVRQAVAAAEAVRTATLEQDAAGLVAAMNPKLVVAMGGPEAALEHTEQLLDALSARGVEFIAFELGRPERAYRASDETVVFVPTRGVLGIDGRRVEVRGFLAASRPREAGGWVFVDGSGIKDRDALHRLFPGLPPNVHLPRHETRPLGY
jgi:hypothetical protein